MATHSVSKTNYKNSFTIATYPDKGKWVAHNLSLDIIGTGKNKKEALKELQDLTVAQLNFAIGNHMEHAINHPAPERFWKMVSEKITANFVGELVSRAGSMTNEKIKEMARNSSVVDINPRRFA